MNYWYQAPDPQLRDQVRTVLVIDGRSEAAPHRLPMFTNGMPAFLCRIDEPADGRAQVQLTLFGNSVPPEYWNISGHTSIIACFFHPFSLGVLFNIAAQRLQAGPIALCDWNPAIAAKLHEQLAQPAAFTGKIAVLTDMLVRQHTRTRQHCELIRYATDELLNNPGPDTLPSLPSNVFLTERSFQRIFKKFVGISPNQYRRICQFQLSFSQVRAQKFDKLGDVANENGFADQSHFNRTFKEFTQITPIDYIRSGLKDEER